MAKGKWYTVDGKWQTRHVLHAIESISYIVYGAIARTESAESSEMCSKLCAHLMTSTSARRAASVPCLDNSEVSLFMTGLFSDTRPDETCVREDRGRAGKCNAKNYGQKCSRNLLNVLHKCETSQSSKRGKDREREGEREGVSEVRSAAKNLLIQVIKLIRDHQHAPTRDRTNEQSV